MRILLFSFFAMVGWGIALVFGKLGLLDVSPLLGLSVFREGFSWLKLTGTILVAGGLFLLKYRAITHCRSTRYFSPGSFLFSFEAVHFIQAQQRKKRLHYEI